MLQRTEHRRIVALVSTLTIAFWGCIAKAAAPANAVEIGYARLSFNSSSGDLSGPPGTTLPGATVGEQDTNTLAFVYERRLTDKVSLVFQVGVPPVVHLVGGGVAAPLGEVGTTRAWFPAILATYSLPPFAGISPYIGAGVSHTWFTNSDLRQSYTQAFGGTSSSGSLGSHTGPVAKIGATIPFASRWTVNLSYSRYWISTSATVNTATPGFGVISRKIDLTANPDVFGLAVGFLF